MLLERSSTLFLYQLQYRMIGQSPWERLWDHPCPGKSFPFGALVIFQANSTREGIHSQRWDAMEQVGACAGYEFHHGYEWTGEYLVSELSSFR